LHKQNKTFPM